MTLPQAAAARVTQNIYDTADRLIQTIVDPAGLKLTTNYAYDAAGNMVAKTLVTGFDDGNSKITRYVYDSENRQIYSVDFLGDVVKSVYDAEGRIIDRFAYATPVNRDYLVDAAGTSPIAVGSRWPLAVSATTVTNAITVNAAQDEHTGYAYDQDGRLRFTIDAIGRPTELLYDGAGNVVHKIEYGGQLTLANTYPIAAVLTGIGAFTTAQLSSTRISRYAYDSANRLAYGTDPQGFVTAYVYDAASNVVKTTQFVTASNLIGDKPLSDLQTWAAANVNADDRITRKVYDAGGRVAFAVDGKSYLTAYDYDAGGRVTAQRRYAAQFSVAGRRPSPR